MPVIASTLFLLRIVNKVFILAPMKQVKRESKDVVYPVRIPREVFSAAKEIADKLDLSTSQLIRAALRDKIAASQSKELRRHDD